jgi:hypothetical protein
LRTLAQVNPDGPTPLSLALHPIDGSPSDLLVEGFKSSVVEDPSGRWFAYESTPPRQHSVTFHRTDGSELNQRTLRFNPRTVAAIDEAGRVSTPAWP